MTPRTPAALAALLLAVLAVAACGPGAEPDPTPVDPVPGPTAVR